MGLAGKVFQRLEQQADTIAEYRQLDEKRRARICELERKLADAERERDKLAAECETLRQQLDAAKVGAEAVWVSAQNLQKDRDHWMQARKDAMTAGELMQAEIETLRGAMAADDQRLRDAEEKVWPGVTWGCDAPDLLADEILHLRQQLDAAQAALTRERLDAEARGHELERLRAFVKLARDLSTPNFDYVDLRILRAALDDLDAGTAEPTPCPECETMRREIEEAQASGFKSMATALAEHQAATTEPTPVDETLDTEGGA
jgi:hypothetical protein